MFKDDFVLVTAALPPWKIHVAFVLFGDAIDSCKSDVLSCFLSCIVTSLVLVEIAFCLALNRPNRCLQ